MPKLELKGEFGEGVLVFDEDNTNPQAFWGTSTRFYVGDNDEGNIFVYNRADSNRYISGESWDLVTANGNSLALWSDGVTMWVMDAEDTFVYAYTILTRARDTSKEFNLHSDNANPTGIWSDTVKMWVSDSVDDKVYAYNLSDGTPSSSDDFNVDTNDEPRGIWCDGVTMWYGKTLGFGAFARTMSTGAADASKNVSASYFVRDLWSDYTDLFLLAGQFGETRAVLLREDISANVVQPTAVPDPSTATATATPTTTLAAVPEVTLVSNTANADFASALIVDDHGDAQAFRTGSNTHGYKITSVTIEFDTRPGTRADVNVHLFSGKLDFPRYLPDQQLLEFSDPTSYQSGNRAEYTTDGYNVATDTWYLIVMEYEDNNNDTHPRWEATESNAQTSDYGRTIHDERVSKVSGTINQTWTNSNTTSNTRPVKLAITGEVRTPPLRPQRIRRRQRRWSRQLPTRPQSHFTLTTSTPTGSRAPTPGSTCWTPTTTMSTSTTAPTATRTSPANRSICTAATVAGCSYGPTEPPYWWWNRRLTTRSSCTTSPDGTCTIKLPIGAVPNLELLGMAMETADDDMISDYRFTTFGSTCAISVVDSQCSSSDDYILQEPADICIPMPAPAPDPHHRRRDGRVEDGSITQIFSTTVRVTGDANDLVLCGKATRLPATVAAVLPTDRSPTETAGTQPPTPVAPDTGPFRAPPTTTLIFLILLGVAITAAAIALRKPARSGRA